MTVACHAPGTAWEGASVAGGPCRWWQVWVLRSCSCVPCVRVSARRCIASSAPVPSGATWHLPVVLGWGTASGRQEVPSIPAGTYFLVAGEMTIV